MMTSTKLNSVLVRAARPIEFVLGVVFLVAAVLKAQDVNLFMEQIYAYGVFQTSAMLGPTAFVVLTLEFFLGVSMVLGLRLRMLTLAAVEVLLVFFTGLIVYAWAVHGLEDCGCFGAVPFTPPEAIAKNVVMMILGAAAWAGLRRSSADAPHTRVAVGKGLVAVVLTIAALAYAYPQLGQTDVVGTDDPGLIVDAGDRPFAGYRIETEYGEVHDLGEGEYIVAVLSMTCEHCMATVPNLNEFAVAAELPTLVAICYEPEEGSMEDFRAMTNPQFPMLSLGNDFLKFSDLIGLAPPRIAFVRDGRLIHFWDEEAPSFEALLAVIEASREPS